jgi:Protein of unknown function (DUF1116)
MPLTPSALAAVFAGAHWLDVVRRDEALPKLGARVLLHAGPPFRSKMPAPVRAAALQAILYEGLAADIDAANEMLATGSVTLCAAQDHGVATPLAQVVSASMPMAVVGNASRRAFAPLVEGGAPALRFGSSAPEALARLGAVAATGLARIAPELRARPLSLAPLIAAALTEGDECHARTLAANRLLLDELRGITPDETASLRGSPNFVLPILMAAALWRLNAPDSPIAAVGGNGIEFGMRLACERRWRVIPALSPQGPMFPGRTPEMALGAIGDSAAIDFCGLGGQALHLAPAVREEWKCFLPEDMRAHRRSVIDPRTGLVDVSRIPAGAQGPCVNLAILDRQGRDGLIGRGVYIPAMTLFEAAGPSRETR